MRRAALFRNAAPNLSSRHRSEGNLLSSRDLIGAETGGTNSRERSIVAITRTRRSVTLPERPKARP